MSIDLSRPLVPSMGHHDALDGFITCAQLRATVSPSPDGSEGPSLEWTQAGFGAMVDMAGLVTEDPLGLGGLLMAACRFEQVDGGPTHEALLGALLVSALEGVEHYARQNDLRRAASQRIAFRELGLAIGLQAIELMDERTRDRVELNTLIEGIKPYAPVGSAIESCWRARHNQETSSWLAHRDINEVMLATRLAPEGYLLLGAGTWNGVPRND
jgi:hypothetical protein